MVCSMTRSNVKVKDKVTSPKVGNPTIFKSYLFRHLQRELAVDHRFFN